MPAVADGTKMVGGAHACIFGCCRPTMKWWAIRPYVGSYTLFKPLIQPPDYCLMP
jgi:hypothetical protein